MKRLGSSDSLGALMSICPNSTDEHNQGNNPMYTRDFQTMLEGLDEDGCIDEGGHVSEKKRRLSVDQVKALEKNFEVENKLEPERKVKLAQELGLQPRQVAVWFQNRRARWKTKQLERDYGVLKANYDALKLNFEALQRDNESLSKEIHELKSKLNEDGKSENNFHAKDEIMASNTDEKVKLEHETQPKCDEAAMELNLENFEHNENGAAIFNDFKDGSSDSDSSAILNDDNIINNNNNDNSPTNYHLHNSPENQQFLDNNNFQFSNSDYYSKSGGGASVMIGESNRANYQAQFVKIEEHNFFGEECCSTFFSDDQAPSLHWYCSDEWN